MLPRVCADLPAVAGYLRRDTEHLRCEEVLRREPKRKGAWWWVRCQLSGLGVGQARRALARAGHCPVEAVQAAGSRDRQGTVLQWFSVPGELVELPQTLKGAGYKRKLKVLEVHQHTHPVDPAAVVALQWRVVFSGAADSYAAGRERLDRLRRQGLPNYFGEAHLGPGGQYARLGRLQLLGRPLPAATRRSAPPTGILLRAVQAQLFNQYLARRLDLGAFDRLLDGDVVETALNRPRAEREWALVEGAAESQARMDSWEIVPLGPLFGRDLVAASGAAAELETAVTEAAGYDAPRLHKLIGGRRAIRVQPGAGAIDIVGDDLQLDCRLPCEAQLDALVDEFLPRA